MNMKSKPVTFAFLLLLFLDFPSFASRSIPLNVKRLSNNIVVIQTQTGNSQVAVLKTEKGLVMIDSGFSPAFARELKALAENSFEHDNWAYMIQTNSAVLNNGGSQAFTGIPIIAHEDAYEAFALQQEELRDYLNVRSVEFEDRVRRAEERLKELDLESESADRTREWIALCRRVAQDFKEGFNLNLPGFIFTDRMVLHLGNLDLFLFYFGSSAEPGDVICWVPQEGFVWLGDVFHALHVLPYGSYDSRVADLSRWIYVFDQILSDTNPVKHVYRCNGVDLWTAETLLNRQDFIRDLHAKTVEADAEGKQIHEVIERLTHLEVAFPYISEWSNVNIPLVQSDIRRTVSAFWKINHTSGAGKIEEMIDSHGLKAAMDFFETIKDFSNASFYLLESEFNALGYKFLRQNHLTEAIAVFKMNTALYPESANVYDSLGEAYMQSGDKKKAILNYQKSLQLNPENANATEMLKKLSSKK